MSASLEARFKKNMSEKFLNIIHVGGRGSGIGPISDFIKIFGDSVDLTIFEADSNLINAGLPNFSYKAKIISKCLSNYIGKSRFNINTDERSSSLFNVSESALDYATPTLWKDNCKTIRTVEVDVTTIDELIKQKEVNSPHFISLDAQGSEYNILEGVSLALSGNLVGVMTEVEFREIYEKQKLFSDIDSLLRKHSFQLFHFFNWQFWRYDDEINEKDGEFPLTAEVLYLRDFDYFLKKDIEFSEKLANLARLITFAFHFKKISYAHKILNYIEKNFQREWKDFLIDSDLLVYLNLWK